MNGLHALAYVSQATRSLQSVEFDQLLADARGFNASMDVTGILFHGKGRFFQYIEGHSQGIDAAYARIAAARTHTDIQVLSHRQVVRREFSAWHMGFCEPPASVLQQLAQARWEEAMPVTRDTVEESVGLGLALQYWSQWLVDRR